jgi:hypothetical protein
LSGLLPEVWIVHLYGDTGACLGTGKAFLILMGSVERSQSMNGL